MVINVHLHQEGWYLTSFAQAHVISKNASLFVDVVVVQPFNSVSLKLKQRFLDDYLISSILYHKSLNLSFHLFHLLFQLYITITYLNLSLLFNLFLLWFHTWNSRCRFHSWIVPIWWPIRIIEHRVCTWYEFVCLLFVSLLFGKGLNALLDHILEER